MNLALNPFDRGKKPEVVDVIDSSDYGIGKILALYHALEWDYNHLTKEISGLELAVLRPEQIAEFADEAINILYTAYRDSLNRNWHTFVKEKSSFSPHASEPILKQYANKLAFFLNRLVQDSFNAGYNGFEFDLNKNRTLSWGTDGYKFDFQKLKIDYLFSGLKGTRRRPLEIKVKEVVGELFAFESQRVNYNIDGDVFGSCFGMRSSSCDFFINGDVKGNQCGDGSNFSLYVIAGDVADNLGLGARDSKFLVSGNVHGSLGRASKRSEFYCLGKCGDLSGSLSKGSYFFAKEAGLSLGDEAQWSVFEIDGYVGSFGLSKDCIFRMPKSLGFKKAQKFFDGSSWLEELK